MKITYDKSADAAYILIGEEIKAGEAEQQAAFIDSPNGQSQVTLDFDKDGLLRGIEVLSASSGLPESVLQAADRI